MPNKVATQKSLNMKHTLSQLFFLVLTIGIISSSSCEKEQEPDLVPITTTGENTMGFYVSGVPYNKKGTITFGSPTGVKYSRYQDGKIKIFGGGGEPYTSIGIYFYPKPLKNDYILSILSTDSGFAESIDDAPLGGNEYFTNDVVTGVLDILRLDEAIISGTFDIQLQNPETGKIIHLTDGRFDIKR